MLKIKIFLGSIKGLKYEDNLLKLESQINDWYEKNAGIKVIAVESNYEEGALFYAITYEAAK